jgi:hypothetical protein
MGLDWEIEKLEDWKIGRLEGFDNIHNSYHFHLRLKTDYWYTANCD